MFRSMRTSILTAVLVVLLCGCDRPPSGTEIQHAVTAAVLRVGHPRYVIYNHVVDSLQVLSVGSYDATGKFWPVRVHIQDSFTIAADSVRDALTGVHSRYFAEFQFRKIQGGGWGATRVRVTSDPPRNMIGGP